jgi:hypothetical protein
MKILHNMAYRAPASDDVMGMTKAQLKSAAEAGDAAAAAELERRKANAAERTQMGGEYRTEAQEKAYSAALAAGGTEVAALQAAGAPADAIAKAEKRIAAAAAKAAAEAAKGKAAAAAAVVTAGQAATEATIAAAEGTGTAREAQAAQGAARAAEAAAIGAGPEKEKKARKKAVSEYQKGRIDLERKYLGLRNSMTLEEAVDLYRAGQWPPQMAAVRNNPLPYPRAQVLYPRPGIVQGGTGPFYGPSGTLFDKMPDLLWDYPDYSLRNNPRMRGVEVLWPQPARRVGPIQGGAAQYMEYPTAAPWDRMPNLTTVLKNKKRSR